MFTFVDPTDFPESYRSKDRYINLVLLWVKFFDNILCVCRCKTYIKKKSYKFYEISLLQTHHVQPFVMPDTNGTKDVSEPVDMTWHGAGDTAFFAFGLSHSDPLKIPLTETHLKKRSLDYNLSYLFPPTNNLDLHMLVTLAQACRTLHWSHWSNQGRTQGCGARAPP